MILYVAIGIAYGLIGLGAFARAANPDWPKTRIAAYALCSLLWPFFVLLNIGAALSDWMEEV